MIRLITCCLLPITCYLFMVSCKKDKVLSSSSAKLSFSQPYITFDTVFTSIGSTTKLFRVHNPNNGEVNISSIKLARGSASFFRLNVDGVASTPGKVFTDVQIAAKDSMYIFVEVTIDPNNQLNPFIYRDSIIFETNGNTQYFSLQAFGQNAYYYMHGKKFIESPTQALYYDTLPGVPNYGGTYTMKNDKPHVIYGYLLVDSSQTLNIQSGAKVYIHGGGGIWVYRYGTIHVGDASSSSTNTVTFQGDRLEQEYKDVPGQWDRIWINEGGLNNSINYAVIKNGYIGVHAGVTVFDGLELPWVTSVAPSKLSLTNTIIQNCSYAGILAHDYTVTGGNDVVVNCGQHILEFDYGGNYSFYQCTFANYWNQTNNSSSSNARTTPSFVFNNYVNGTQVIPFDSLFFGNCIFDGSLAEEFQFNTMAGGFTHPYFFDHCALKTGIDSLKTNGVHTSSPIIINPPYNPMGFNNTATYDFSIPVNHPSAAPNAGNSTYSTTPPWNVDIKGTNRTHPDLGAYAITP